MTFVDIEVNGVLYKGNSEGVVQYSHRWYSKKQGKWKKGSTKEAGSFELPFYYSPRAKRYYAEGRRGAVSKAEVEAYIIKQVKNILENTFGEELSNLIVLEGEVKGEHFAFNG